MLQKILDGIKSAIEAIFKIRLWQVVLLGIVVLAGVLIYIFVRAYHPIGTTSVPDTPPGPIPHFDKRLDAFRAAWDIKGRFETWPALLPLAEMSDIAYSEKSKADELFKQNGFDSVVAIESPFHSEFAYVASAEDVMIIAFRGTQKTEDWLFNVDVYPWKMPEGILHFGFSSAYGTLQTRILELIESSHPKHIWITGHSLGGALALVCAYDLEVFHKITIDGVITFGQPKIGNKELADNLQKILGERYVHFVNELDGVPHMPLGFVEFGCLIQFLEGRVQKSSNYFPKLATVGKVDGKPRVNEYVAIDHLAEITKKGRFAHYEWQKAVADANAVLVPDYAVVPDIALEPHVSNQYAMAHLRDFTTSGANPFHHADPFSSPNIFSPLTDHSMDLYVGKIRAAIEKANHH